jgi:lipoprotein-anchoring transpeptidase ErfK/SrfK
MRVWFPHDSGIVEGLAIEPVVDGRQKGTGMRKLIRVLIGVAMATVLVGAVGLTTGNAVFVNSAAATVSYPKKGQTSTSVYELQQRLVKAKALKSRYQTGHYNMATVKAVRLFQKGSKLAETGKINQTTWAALVRLTGAKPALTVKGIPKRCKTHGRVLCIDKTMRKLYYVKNSKVVKIMDARFGCRSRPTRMGTFHIFRKSRYHTSTIYHVYMPYAMFFSGGQAVHWSSAFTKHGYHGCSHGCVNIRDKAGVRWLFDQMHLGDRVVVYRS